jgi:SAM-dependent methyltransferase
VKEYPSTFSEHSSYGSALRLLEGAGALDGVVLDLGCGRSPLAEPLAERGLVHVACDVDTDALAALAERGSETHRLSLLGGEDELVTGLHDVVGERPLAAVLALDVLEHLPDPVTVARAVRRLVLDRAGGGDPAPFVVSIPNVTHADVAAKLLLGRWDVDETGLLDDTHLRFFGADELGRFLAAGGWAEADRADVHLAISDQAFPTDAPSVRPGAPLRELVRAVRRRADGHAETYQFVRRLVPNEPVEAPYVDEVDEGRPLLGVVVVTGPGEPAEAAGPLLADLARQDPPVESVTVVGRDDLDAALRSCPARWVALLAPTSRLSPRWSAVVAEFAELAAGRVVRLAGVAAADHVVGALGPGPVEPAEVPGLPLDTGAFDPLHAAGPGAVAADPYLVPTEAVRVAGLVPGRSRTLGLERPLWLARAVQLSGVLGIDEPVVAVARSSLLAPGAMAFVARVLDEDPMLLPAGSAGRLADLRARVVAGEAAVVGAEARAEAAEHRASHYAAHLERVAAEAEGDRAELEVIRAERRRREERRRARWGWLRRLLGGGVRS